MSLWSQISDFLATITTQALSSAVEALRTVFEGDPQTRKQVTFSIAIIALSAKMAKADGIVTQDEVSAFQQLFQIPEKESSHVARVYNLAKQDVAGFEAYAGQVKRLFPEDVDILRDVIDGLFHIAKADGAVHEMEMQFVDIVASIFELDDREINRIKMRHLQPETGDPYVMLGADPNWDNETLKKYYRRLLMENHPDRMIARGVPQEFLKIANDRLVNINIAWSHICKERKI